MCVLNVRDGDRTTVAERLGEWIRVSELDRASKDVRRGDDIIDRIRRMSYNGIRVMNVCRKRKKPNDI